MKFLTMSTIKDSFYSLSPAEQAKLMTVSIQNLLELKKKMGSKWSFFYTPGMAYQVSLGEYTSLEEYSQSLMSPMAIAGYMEYETHPLVEMDEKAMQGYLETKKPKK